MSNKLAETIGKIIPLDKTSMEAAAQRQNELTKPAGSLGRLEELSVKIAGIRRTAKPVFKNKEIIVMAADHGVVREGVSAFPQEVTRQMVFNFLNGNAAINVLARHAGAAVKIVDMGVVGGFDVNPSLICKMIDFGTKNMAEGPAMTRQQAIDAVESGIDIINEQLKNSPDIVGTGDMGIGNTTAASAVCAAITGKDVLTVTGRGTGIDEKQLSHKAATIKKALEVNKPDAADGLDVLAKVGGFEIGGLAGVILACAANHIPVVIDGFISGAAALIATTIAPASGDYIIASHLSVEPGHSIMMEHLHLKPLLELDMRLGEGTGAALAISLADAAVKVLNEMATFTEAGVSGKNEEE